MTRPPRITESLLRRVLSDGVVGRSIVGDLREEFAWRVEREGETSARRWYRHAARGVIARRIITRVRVGDDWSARTRSKQTVNGRRGDPMVKQWISEMALAVRTLSRAPGFAVVTTLTLGLAIGANAAIFSVVDGVLLSPLPYGNADELVSIRSSTPGNNTPPDFGVSPEFYLQYRDNASMLQGIALYSGFGGTINIDGVGQRVRGAEVTQSFFETLGVSPILGRLPTVEEVTGSSTPSQQMESGVDVALISHAFWTQEFAANPAIVGQTVNLNDSPRTIIGVLPPDMALPERETAVWIPFEVDAENVNTGQFRWSMIGRLSTGTEPESLQAQLEPLAARLPEIYNDSPRYVSFMVEGQYRPVVLPLKEQLVGDLEQPLWILLGTVGFVLLIACANVANLFLVRAESRQRDMAVRAAMGAGRAQLVRAHLSEAFVLAGLGGALGAALAWAGVPLLVAAAPDGIPRIEAVALDGGVLAFTGALSLLSALLFGLATAIRYSSPKLLARLRYAGRGAIGGKERHLARNTLVIAQSGLALVLLVGSGLLVRSFAELMNTDPGFETEDILTFQVALPFESYNSAAAMADFHMSMLDRFAALPGVESVGAVQDLPLDESPSGTAFALTSPPRQGTDCHPLFTTRTRRPGTSRPWASRWRRADPSRAPITRTTLDMRSSAARSPSATGPAKTQSVIASASPAIPRDGRWSSAWSRTCATWTFAKTRAVSCTFRSWAETATTTGSWALLRIPSGPPTLRR